MIAIKEGIEIIDKNRGDKPKKERRSKKAGQPDKSH